MTLDEMIQETGSYIDETLVKSNNQYIEVNIFNKIKSALNYAYRKICREKYKLTNTETVNIIDEKINVNSLSKKFLELVTIEDSEGSKLFYEVNGDIISVPDTSSAVVRYYYSPAELVNLTDAPLLPEAVDHRILCYFAAFQYLNIEGDDRAAKWITLWNDGFEDIRQKREPKQIKIKNNVGW